jgi:hypothetical protein
MAVSARKADDQRGYAFGQLVRVGGAVSSDHLGNTRDLCGFDGSAGAAFSGNQHMHVAGNSGGGGDGVQNDGNDCRIIVIGDDQDCHQMTSRFIFKFVDKFGDRFHLYAAFALRRAR